MINRKEKIEDLLQNFLSVKRIMAFHSSSAVKLPRITPSQWGVLMFVKQHSGSTVKDVAKALSISSSATTQLVDGLVESGYLLRELPIKDRRTVILTLSKKTTIQVNKMKKEGLEKFLKFFEVLNDREFSQYILLNQKIVDSLLKNKTIK